MRMEPEKRRCGGGGDCDGSGNSGGDVEAFSLILIDKKAEKVKKDVLCAGHPVKKGWWIVAVTFFEYIDKKRYVYTKLPPSPFYVVVTALLRIGHVEFERSSGDRHYMSADTHAQTAAAM